MRCVVSKRLNDMLNMEPNEKLQRYCTLVLIRYGLVELIIEASHLTKDYLIVDIHTHHTCLCSINAIFICVIVLD